MLQGNPAGLSAGPEGSPAAANESGEQTAEQATIAELRVKLQQAEEKSSVFAQVSCLFRTRLV